MENSLKVSVLSLIKSNNGLFKSEKQKDFLFTKLSQLDGFIGCNFKIGSLDNSQLFVKFDENGITHLYKGDKLTWQKTVKGTLTPIQEKHLKKLNNQKKKLQKDYEEREKSFYNCTYSKGILSIYDYNEETVFYYVKTRYSIILHIESIEKYILENF